MRDEHGNEVVMRCTKERVCWSSPTDSRGALPNNVYHTGTCTSIGRHIAQYEYCTTYCVLTPLLTPPLGVSTPAVLTPNLLFPTNSQDLSPKSVPSLSFNRLLRMPQTTKRWRHPSHNSSRLLFSKARAHTTNKRHTHMLCNLARDAR